jgi:outer membrane immunogenic protein
MNSETSRFARWGVSFAVTVAVMNPFDAFAADLPQTMYTKAPPAIAAAPPYRWSGLYIGGHLGYLWGRTRVDDDGVTTEHNARTDGVIGGAMIGYNW